MNKKITQELEAEIIRMANEGVKQKVIAKTLNIAQATVCRIKVKHLGTSTRGTWKRGEEVPEEKKAEVIELWRKGWSLASISNKCGLTVSMVHKTKVDMVGKGGRDPNSVINDKPKEEQVKKKSKFNPGVNTNPARDRRIELSVLPPDNMRMPIQNCIALGARLTEPACGLMFLGKKTGACQDCKIGEKNADTYYPEKEEGVDYAAQLENNQQILD